jgi:hypothetical protein
MKRTIRLIPFFIGALGAMALYGSTVAPALADDCQAIKSAVIARERASYSSVTTMPTMPDVTVRDVMTPTRHYAQVQGTWSSEPRKSLKERLQAVDEQLKSSNGGCRRTRTASIGGQAADVYTDAAGESGDIFWISKSTNLLLKMSLNLGSNRTITTYSYGNVQVPAGVR